MFILLGTLRAMEALETNSVYVYVYLANKADSDVCLFSVITFVFGMLCQLHAMFHQNVHYGAISLQNDSVCVCTDSYQFR